MESSVARCPGSVSFPPLSPDCTLSTRVHLAPALLGPEALGAATHRSKFLLTWYHLRSRNAVQSLHPLGGRKRVFDGLTLYIVRWGPTATLFILCFPFHTVTVNSCIYIHVTVYIIRQRWWCAGVCIKIRRTFARNHYLDQTLQSSGECET